MDHLGNVPKAIFIHAKAERLADSKGDEQDRIQFVQNDPDNRYAVAYQAIADAPEKGIYHLRNPIKKHYWVPLKVSIDGKETWVLVNKASLHKRFGLSYEMIDASAKKGVLNELVENRAYQISLLINNKDDPDASANIRGKFVNEGAKDVLKSDWFAEGKVKDRYKLVALDPDNEYAVHYKSLEKQPKAGAKPELSSFEKRYWTPYNIDNGDGTNIWILLNKSSLCKRLDIDRKNIDALDNVPNGPDLLANFLKEILKPKFYEIELYGKCSKLISESIRYFQDELVKEFENFRKSDKATEQIEVLKERIKDLATNLFDEIEEPMEEIRTVEINAVKRAVDTALGEEGSIFEGLEALGKLGDNLNKANLVGRMNHVLTIFDSVIDELQALNLQKQASNELKVPIRKQLKGLELKREHVEEKFVKAAAEKLTESEGQVKNRYIFVSNDPDNAYAVHYKAVNQPAKGSLPALNDVQKRFWVPYRADNGDGTNTWILLNKSSLRKRFEIDVEELEGHIKKGDLPAVLDAKVREIDWNYTKSVEEKEKYVEISKEIMKATNSYALKLQEKFKPYYDLKLRTSEDKSKFRKELKELMKEFGRDWENVIEPQLRSLENLDSDRFKKLAPVVDEALGEIKEKLNKLIGSLGVNAFPGIKMGKILKDFQQLHGDLDAPIQKLEREKYERLSHEIIGSMESFRGYLQNRFVFFKYEPGLDVTFYAGEINKEFEELKDKIIGQFSEIQKLDANRYKNVAKVALGRKGDISRIGDPLADLLANLQGPDFSSKMDDILKICEDIIKELNVFKPKV